MYVLQESVCSIVERCGNSRVLRCRPEPKRVVVIDLNRKCETQYFRRHTRFEPIGMDIVDLDELIGSYTKLIFTNATEKFLRLRVALD